jgi:hypothetical protein
MDGSGMTTLADVGHQHHHLVAAGDGTEALLSSGGEVGGGHHIIFTGEDGQSELCLPTTDLGGPRTIKQEDDRIVNVVLYHRSYMAKFLLTGMITVPVPVSMYRTVMTQVGQPLQVS